jgi:PEP-CTERM motif
MSPRRLHLLFLFFILVTSNSLHADTIVSLGILSYDSLIPGSPGAPGVNGFSIGNFTGNPSAGGFALPPSFDVYTALTFTNSALTLNQGTSSTVVALGDIGPGFFIDSLGLLQFSDTTLFSSAVFSTTLSPAAFTLSDGTILSFRSQTINLTLSPSFGGSLLPGDLAVISAAAVVVPEPGTLLLFGTAAGLLLLRKSIRRKA